MRNRLIGIVATLWFFFAVLSLFMALAISPMGLRLLLPGTRPITWLYPALLIMPPVILACQNGLGAKLSRTLLWLFASVLAAFALVLFAFLSLMFVGH